MAIMIKNQDVQIFSDADAVCQFAAEDFLERAKQSISTKGNFSVVLSGGNTPKLFFDKLTNEPLKKNIPWAHIQFFFGDERGVPMTDSENNYHTANTYLFSKVPVNKKNIYPIPTELGDPEANAALYAKVLNQTVKTDPHGFPVFDLCYLGLGDDAHTASLMPQSEIVKHYATAYTEQQDPLVAALFVPKLNQFRFTLTPPVINHSLTIIFLVTGSAKADAVCKVLKGSDDKINYPAQLIHATSGKTLWYLDEAAASKLSSF